MPVPTIIAIEREDVVDKNGFPAIRVTFSCGHTDYVYVDIEPELGDNSICDECLSNQRN